jgi:uncharacterized protein (TIRG00374 family)
VSSPAEAPAPRRRSSPIVNVAAFLIGGICLWLALRSIDAAEFEQVIRQAAPGWLAMASAILLVSYLLRAIRWQVVLDVRGPHDRLLGTLYWATGLGYALNSLLPARAGDVARSAAASSALSIRLPRVLASTVVERVFDAAFLAGALMLAVPVVDSLPDWLLSTARLVGALALVALLTAVVVGRRSATRTTTPEERASGIASAIASFGSGLLLVSTPSRVLRVLVLTAAIWAVDVVLAIALGAAFGITLQPVEALCLLAAFGLASAAPSTPGFVGVYQAIAVAVLVPLGSSAEAAVAFATALQVITLATSGAVALIGTVSRRGRHDQPGTSRAPSP